MKIDIDISVFHSTVDSYGVINGSMELPVVPRVGESVSFGFPINEGAIPPEGRWWPSALRVENVLHTPGIKGTSVLLSLESVVFESREQCVLFSQYMEKGFGLFADEHVK